MLKKLFVLLFLLIIKFPKNKNFFNYIRQKYGSDLYSNLRRIIKTKKKIQKLNLDAEFLRLCLFHDVIPKFIVPKLYKHSLHDVLFVKKFKLELLKAEICSKTKDLTKLSSTYADFKSNTLNKLTLIDSLKFTQILNQISSEFSRNTKARHVRKLQQLSIESPKMYDPDKVI